MSAILKKSRLLLYIGIILVSTIIILAYFYNDKNKRVEQYLENKNQSLQIQYNTIYENYKVACDNVYASLQDNRRLLTLFSKAKDSSTSDKNIIRDEMFEMLKDRYERIKKFGIWQLHFHLPDNESFLRMHKKDKFGDNLTGARYSVEYVNKNKKFIKGFEVGKIVHGFRFVYPLFIDKNEYIGSVEISMSSEIFKQTIEHSYRSHVDFIILSKVIKDKLWEDQIDSYYVQSVFSKEYLKKIDDIDVDLVLSSKKLSQIDRKLKTDKIFSILVKTKQNTQGILTFLPVKNLKDNKKVAYLVSYLSDPFIYKASNNFYIICCVVLVLALIITGYVIKDEIYKYSLEISIEKKTISLEQKNKQIQRKYDEQMYILNTLDEAVIIYENNNYIQSNYATQKMLGFELSKKGFLEFLEDKEEILSEIKKEDKHSLVLETYVANQDKRIPILFKYNCHCTKYKCIQIVTLVDLTYIKAKEKQLLQQSKLAQMGEMISMIAHQWRQPLSAISSTVNSMILKSAMGEYDESYFRKKLGNISEYTQHLSNTIDDFRNFFKQNKEKKSVTIEELVEDSLKIIENSLNSFDIKVIKQYNLNRNIDTYPNELRQVILNLLKNSEDIFKESNMVNKTITIKTYLEDKDHILKISDNAGGIPEDIIEKIFDPYFSTKIEKDGTGLGLYMSKVIVEDHCGGQIVVSNENGGASFKVII